MGPEGVFVWGRAMISSGGVWRGNGNRSWSQKRRVEGSRGKVRSARSVRRGEEGGRSISEVRESDYVLQANFHGPSPPSLPPTSSLRHTRPLISPRLSDNGPPSPLSPSIQRRPSPSFPHQISARSQPTTVPLSQIQTLPFTRTSAAFRLSYPLPPHYATPPCPHCPTPIRQRHLAEELPLHHFTFLPSLHPSSTHPSSTHPSSTHPSSTTD